MYEISPVQSSPVHYVNLAMSSDLTAQTSNNIDKKRFIELVLFLILKLIKNKLAFNKDIRF